MASTGKSNLVVNERNADVNWFNGGTDLFQPRAWFKAKNHVFEEFAMTAASNVYAYGGAPIVFEIDRRAAIWGGGRDTYFELTRGALSSTTPTYTRFDDWEGPLSIDYIDFEYNNRKFFKLRGDKIHREIMRCLSQEERTAQGVLANGNLTAGQRDVTAASAATTVTKLFLPWRKLKKGIHMNCLPNKIRVSVYLKSIATIVQTDGTSPTATITNAVLRCPFMHMKQQDEEAHYSMSRTKDGFSWKFASVEEHFKTSLLSTDINPYRFKLSNLKNSSYLVSVFTRTKTDVDNTDSTKDYWDYVTPPIIGLYDTGTAITELVGVNLGLYGHNVAMFPKGVVGWPVASKAFCPDEFVEASEDDCFGSRALGNYHNLELYLDYSSGSTVGTNYWFDVESMIHNTMIHVGGDLRAYLM